MHLTRIELLYLWPKVNLLLLLLWPWAHLLTLKHRSSLMRSSRRLKNLVRLHFHLYIYILLETPVMCPSSLYNPLECHNIIHSSSYRKVFSDKTTNLPLQMGERQGVILPSFEENYYQKNRKYTLIHCWVTLIVIFKFLFVPRVGFAREIMKTSFVGLISVASPVQVRREW